MMKDIKIERMALSMLKQLHQQLARPPYESICKRDIEERLDEVQN